MLRRASLALFLLALSLVVACGRQVTPNPTFSNLTGSLEVKFRTVGTPNFQQYNYFIAINTNGNGQEPYASGFQNGQYANFSYAVVTGASSAAAALPILLQYYVVPGANQVRTLQFNLNPATTQLQLNTATTSAYNEFIVIFARSQLNLPSPTGTGSPSPAPTPSPTPTKGGPTPTPTPSGASPSPSASPSALTWCINLFTTNGNGSIIYDALGFGAQDHSFNSGCFNVSAPVDRVYNQVIPELNGGPQDNAAALYGFELINSP